MMSRWTGLKLLLTFCCILGAVTPSFGSQKTYILPEEFRQDILANKAYLAENPESARAYFELAMSYAYSGLIEKGWATLRVIPDYDDDYAPEVLEEYTAKAKAEPDNWKHRFKLAFGYYFKKDKEESIRQFQEVLKIDPKNIWAMGFIGLVHGDLNREDETLKICNEALKIEPNAAAIHFLIAEAYRRKEEYWKATTHIFMVGRLRTADKLSGQYDDL